LKLKVKYMDPRELKPYEKNAKEHPDWQVEQIAELILRFGFNDPVGIASDTMEIIEGHGRLLAWKSSEDIQKKHPKIPTIDLKDLTPSERKAYRLAHNKSTMNTGMIPEMEVSELSFLEEEGWDVTTLGWTDEELLKIGVRDRDETIDDEDEIPEPPENPQTKPGDIYQLGEHRLMCGDVEKLLEGAHIDLTIIDPPFEASEKQWTKHIRDPCIVYGQGKHIYSIPKGLYRIERIIVKPPSQSHRSATVQALHQHVLMIQCGTEKVLPEKNVTINSVYVDKEERDFRYSKPLVPLIENIENWTRDVKVIFDPYGGCGTTLIVAERTGRRCYMMEIEPIYCDVIIKRWENETGKKAKKIKGDRG